jgi:hypothetical protein
MIREHPLFGVGIGAFHFLEIDYSRLLLGQFLPFDNAQNWFRHQLVELGLVGSVGWILWTVTFGWFVIRRSRVSSPPAVIAARGAILAVVAVSLVGMPTQNTALAIAFWTLAFWFVQLEDDGATLEQRGARSIRPLGWAIVWAIVAVAAAGTVYSARHSLRLPFRAARFDWPFSYGFYARETGPAGSYQWVGRYGVTVLDATQPWMRVTVAANHVDLEHKPVIAEVSIDRVSILTATLRSSAPVVRYVHLQPGARRVVLEARASRVVRPQDYGGSDPRQLGAMIGWEFVSGRGD